VIDVTCWFNLQMESDRKDSVNVALLPEHKSKC
jgi:hypothetical protein